MRPIKRCSTIAVLFIGTFWLASAQPWRAVAGEARASDQPLFKSIDLNVGESSPVTLSNGKVVTVRLVDLKEKRCDLRGAVRRAEVVVEVAGQREKFVSATYNMTIGFLVES